MIVILLALTIMLVYMLNKHLFSFWEKRGFKQINDPTFILGNSKPLLTMEKSLGEFFTDFYNKFKDTKVMGLYYMFYRPILLVNDAKIVQDILVRDFSSFHDRPMPCDEKNDPLSANLFQIHGQSWRDLRVKLSPLFTSGKLKMMFPIIKNVGQVFEDYLISNMKNNVDVFEFRDLMARFNTNIISSVAFGIDNDCINDPDHIFRRMGAKVFEPNFSNGIKNSLAFLIPKSFHKLKLKVFDSEVEKFIYQVVKENVEFRETNNFSRNDFLQLLIQLKNQGFVPVDRNEKNDEGEKVDNAKSNIKKINIDQLTANIFLFFFAGFETSSSTLSFCLFELARNPEIQRKVQEEIDKVLMDSGDETFTYESLSKLKYLECCVDETLRKYPILPMHFRTAAKDYKIRDSELVIPKGTSVFIPVLGMHRDPEIYDNPMEFQPERFLDSSHGNGKVEGVFYTPFGDGPRNCIGMRLGKITTRIGLALIFKNFNVQHTDPENLTKELEFEPKQVTLAPNKKFNLKITHRN